MNRRRNVRPGTIGELFSDALVTLYSTVLVQLSTFTVLALSGALLSLEDFAELSVLVASVMISSVVLELGINTTATKLYGEAEDERFLQIAVLVRYLIALVMMAVAGAVFWIGYETLAIGLVLGGALNVWNGVRSNDQARQDYRSFLQSNVVFAALRFLFGLGALWYLKDPVSIAFGIYALPIAAALFSKAIRFRLRDLSITRAELRRSAGYAFFVYSNAVAFSGAAYLPQLLISERMGAADIGTYGLLLTFTAPLTLVVYSVRSVFLPKMLRAGNNIEPFLWSRRGLAVILLAWLAIVVAGCVCAVGLDMIYGVRFPLLRDAFLIFFAGYSATSLIGIYSLSVHTKGIPGIAASIGALKLAVLAAGIYFFADELLEVVALTASCMLLFEIVLVLLLWKVRTA